MIIEGAEVQLCVKCLIKAAASGLHVYRNFKKRMQFGTKQTQVVETLTLINARGFYKVSQIVYLNVKFEEKKIF